MSEQDIDDGFNAPAEVAVKTTREDVVAALVFSAPKEVNTKRGPRLVSNAKPSVAFLELWNSEDREWLLAQGLSVGPDYKTKETRVSKWEKLPEKVVVERKAAIEMSRATDAEINAPCPDGLAYLPYQRAGVAFGYTRPAVLIGDEMGLGKTIQAIGILNCALADSPATPRVLIICPASLKLNWRRELEKWLIRKLTIFVADSKVLPDLAGVVIVNYDVLHKHEAVLTKGEFDLLIVDEAHYLKNGNARRSKMVFGIKATFKQRQAGIPDVPGIRAKKRLFLTGTPISNRPAELFPLISFLDPLNWPDFFRYAVRYCNGHQRQFSASKAGWDFTGSSHLEELQDRLRGSIMIRRLKKDVLKDLPAKRRQVIELPAVGDAAEAVTSEREAYDNGNGLAGLEAAVELAKASEDPNAYGAAVDRLAKGQSGIFSELSTLRLETALAKIPVALEHIRDAAEESEKIVIFAHHKAVVRALAEEFGEAAVTLVGDTPMQERQDAVDRFQTDPTCKVFIGSIMAAGVGITLTAASHVIFFELDWVPGNVSQAEDRLHRIGQKESVLVQHLVLEGSLDAVMARRIIKKQDVIDRALDTKAEESATVEGTAATASVKREALSAEAAAMTEDELAATKSAIRIVAARCDGAHSRDESGFNGCDTMIGKSLAEAPFLSRKQCALARKIVWKYKGQLPDELVARLKASSPNPESTGPKGPV